MARGHRKGHHQDPAETLALLALNVAGGGLNFAQTFNTAALVAAPTPATVLDGSTYTEGTNAKGNWIVVSMHGQMDAQATVTAQIMRGATALGTPITIFSDAAGLFGGTLAALEDHPIAGPVTYSVQLSSAGRTFSVGVGAASFMKDDVTK